MPGRDGRTDGRPACGMRFAQRAALIDVDDVVVSVAEMEARGDGRVRATLAASRREGWEQLQGGQSPASSSAP